MRKKGYVFKLLLLLVLGCLLNGCREKQEVLLYEEESAAVTAQELTAAETHGETETQGSTEIRVYVCGAVASPGVVTLTRQERVCDAIAKAGGLTEDAEPRAVNQAGFLEDGMQILVPTIEEAQEGAVFEGIEAAGQTEAGKVNLNKAEAEELKSLPGIGDAKAADIIRYREEHGGFKDIEEIKNISGIKDAVFEKLKDKIAV